jgi:hypothetical protein
MQQDVISAIGKMENGESLSQLSSNEQMVFPQVLINAMIEEGIK